MIINSELKEYFYRKYPEMDFLYNHNDFSHPHSIYYSHTNGLVVARTRINPSSHQEEWIYFVMDHWYDEEESLKRIKLSLFI